jgi:hypothetical protein
MELFQRLGKMQEFTINSDRSTTHTLGKLAGGTFCFFLFLFVYEYIQWHWHVRKIMRLQIEYKESIDALKRIFDSYEPCDGDGRVVQQGTENEQRALIPDENSDTAADSFLLLNRDSHYLRESMRNYFKEQSLDECIDQMNWLKWHSYTDELLLTNDKRDSVAKCGEGKKMVSGKGPIASQSYTNRLRHVMMAGRKLFDWPVDKKNCWLSSLYGLRKKKNGTWGFHYGVDMAAVRGTPVCAAAPGIVTEARVTPGYGNTIVITHDKIYKTRYAHLNIITTHVGKQVCAREKIGTVGDSGHTVKMGNDASHLHFAVYEREKPVNPLYYLRP